MPYIYFISQQKPETTTKEVTILGVIEEGDEEFLQLLTGDDCICQINRDDWKPVSHLIKKGAIHANATMEGTIVTKLEIIQKEE